ncbi:MAG: hypothetical protein SGJ19_07375 [Planctomycetia bacterium]|nr:hypothetical protein [Planctomycetia bacterium]
MLPAQTSPSSVAAINTPPSAPAPSANGSKLASLSNILGKAVWTVALAASIGLTGLVLLRGGAIEESHANWKHVAAATQQSQRGDSVMTFVDASGVAQPLREMTIPETDSSDLDANAIRRFAESGSEMAATELLLSAQRIPEVKDTETDAPLERTEPVVNTKLAPLLKDERTSFYHVHLFDCCDEDGDVVEIIINNAPFAVVPITNQGATLTIPLQSGETSALALRGIRDGGGGITISVETSDGVYYCEAMEVGQEISLGIVTK